MEAMIEDKNTILNQNNSQIDLDRRSLFFLPDNTGALYELKKNPDDGDELIPFKLIKKTQITHDTYIFTFQLPENMYLGLHLGHHIAIEAPIKTDDKPLELGENISRKYTPISTLYERGKFDILIKIYYKGSHPNFPEGGILTQWIDKLEIGTDVMMKGPKGRLYYYGDGNFKYGSKEKPVVWTEKNFNKVGMLCGGTGIAPFYQLLQAADVNKDTIEYSLIFGNRSAHDILLKEELDTMNKNQNFKFNLQYTIDKYEKNWEGLVGYITHDKIQKYLPPPSDDTLILLCGRGKMCKKYLKPMLIEMGYKPEYIYIF